jgi:hypothetical protein
VVNFAFTETGPASGTKGPDNPSAITGVTQAKVTRCGKNLLVFPYYSSSFTSNGVTFTVGSDGSVSTSGTASGDVDFYIASSSNGPWLNSGLSYTLSGCPSGGSTSTYYMRHSAYPTAADTGGGATFTASASGKPAQPIIIRIKSGANMNNLVFKPQLELGPTATSFEPYEGTDYTIDLNGTYYGGSVDLSAGTMTVTHEGFYATAATTSAGIASSFISGDFAFCLIPAGFAIKYDNTQLTSTRFVTASSGNIERVYCRGGDSFYSLGCYIDKSRLDFSSAVDPSSPTAAEITAAFSAWLASNPTFICVKRTEPITVPITPTQIYSLSQPDPYTPRINTVYSDQTSVQVGYPKSPQATAAELTNAIISLGSNL